MLIQNFSGHSSSEYGFLLKIKILKYLLLKFDWYEFLLNKNMLTKL